jgi:hypothetical protein
VSVDSIGIVLWKHCSGWHCKARPLRRNVGESSQGIRCRKRCEIGVRRTAPYRGGRTFALDLKVAALLAGAAGCDTLTFDGEVPTFSSDSSTLQFMPGGPLTMIGKFSQQPTYPTYWLFRPRDVMLGIFTDEGYFLYRCNG